MSMTTAIGNTMVKAINTGMLFAKKYAPQIMFGCGAVSLIGAVGFSAKAGYDIHAENERHKSVKQQSVYDDVVVPKSEYDENTEMLRANDIMHVGNIAKSVAPAAILTIISLGCFTGSTIILNKRNTAVMAAYKACDEAFKQYRERIADIFGEDEEKLIKLGLTKNENELLPVDNLDEEESEDTYTQNSNTHTQHAVFFDEASPYWSKIPMFNKNFLISVQNEMNEQLHKKGHVFLNEVFDRVGVPRTPAGSIEGWIDDGTDKISFGIFNAESVAARDFVNGYEKSILLDFNVDGVIYDLI